MTHLKAFAAGFISTLAFHQGMLGLFYVLGVFPRAPFALTPTEPLGIPSVISLAFWGGVWGVALWPIIKNAVGTAFWLRCLVLGAIGPTAVALFIVFPMKGMAFAAGWDPKIIIGALILNGAWGLGLGLLMRALRKL